MNRNFKKFGAVLLTLKKIARNTADVNQSIYDSDTTPVLLVETLTERKEHTQHIQKEKSNNSPGGQRGWRVAVERLALFTTGRGRTRDEQGGVKAAREDQQGGNEETYKVLVDSPLFTCAHSCANSVCKCSKGLYCVYQISCFTYNTAASIAAAASSLSFWNPDTLQHS